MYRPLSPIFFTLRYTGGQARRVKSHLDISILGVQGKFRDRQQVHTSKFISFSLKKIEDLVLKIKSTYCGCFRIMIVSVMYVKRLPVLLDL